MNHVKSTDEWEQYRDPLQNYFTKTVPEVRETEKIISIGNAFLFIE